MRGGPGTARLAAVVAGFLLGAALLVPAEARAGGKARVTVTVILAKKEPPHLHPALQPLWDTLKQSFGDKFGNFDQVGETTRTVDEGQPVETTLPTGERFAAIYGGVTPDKGLLRVNVEMGEFRTKVRIHDGGVFFQAGKRFKDGTLIVAVRAALAR
jgi:hypothetical protein